MKTFNLFIQFIVILNTLLFSNAFGFSSLSSFSLLSSSSSSSNYIQELKDNRRDIKNYQGYENIERDIRFNGKRTLDVYYDKTNTQELKPVVVFLYGGAWITGSKVKFNRFGYILQNDGYVAVLPNYVLFPHGGFEDMVDDVYKALRWTFDNIERYGGDPKRVSLSGYSAGAHLSALTLLKSTFNLENKRELLEPLPILEKVVLISGPYDFDDYSQTIKFISKTENSLVEKFVRHLFKTTDVSPTDILKPFLDGSLKTLGAKKFVFYYSSKDKEVKESSAKNLMAQMKRVCPSVEIEYVYKEGYEHTSITRNIRAGKKEDEEYFLNLFKM